jgi:hypothetical protein
VWRDEWCILVYMNTTARTGNRYNETRSLDVADVAKLIRADIKAAVKDGKLPKGPRYSVRTNRFSGGCSIDVNVTNWVGDCRVKGSDPRSCTTNVDFADTYVYTAEADAAVKVLRSITGAYNRDNSDSQTDYYDVRFYSHVQIG